MDDLAAYLEKDVFEMVSVSLHFISPFAYNKGNSESVGGDAGGEGSRRGSAPVQRCSLHHAMEWWASSVLHLWEIQVCGGFED